MQAHERTTRLHRKSQTTPAPGTLKASLQRAVRVDTRRAQRIKSADQEELPARWVWKLIYSFLNTSADHIQRLSPVVLHGVDLHFNFKAIQVFRKLDLQYWANFVFPRIHRFGWILYLLEETYILDMNRQIRILTRRCPGLS